MSKTVYHFVDDCGGPCLGVLQLLQEVLASHIAGVPSRRVAKEAPFYEHALARAKLDTKALKMAFYGFFVSAPLGHLLVGLLQKMFAGRTDLKAKIGQILASNLVVAPVQISGESQVDAGGTSID